MLLFITFLNYNANEWVTGAKKNVVSFNILAVLLSICEGMTVLNPAFKVSVARLMGRQQQPLHSTAPQREAPESW